MRHEIVRRFLENQKKRLLKLDGALESSDWLTEAEENRYQFSVRDSKLGRRYGLMEMLYDNTIEWIMSQSRGALRFEFYDLEQPGVISEDTTTASIATFTTALLPAVRRIYASLISMNLVTVQPLRGPSGYIYWLDHVYTSNYTTDGITAGDRMDEDGTVDSYTDSSEQGTIREIQFKLSKKLIETESKKVKADYTLESEQDLRSQWGLDLEGELVPELSNQIVREVDRKVINALAAGAGAGNVNWNKNTPASDTTTADKLAYYQTLYHAIAEANTSIFQKKFVNANWLLMNGNTYYYFQRLENFNADPLASGQDATLGRRFVGTLAGLYKVYLDPWFSDNKILMGVRGDSWKYAIGYYAPYVPLFLSDKYIANDDFTQFIKGAMTRYAYGVLPESSTQSPVKNNGLATITLTSS